MFILKLLNNLLEPLEIVHDQQIWLIQIIQHAFKGSVTTYWDSKVREEVALMTHSWAKELAKKGFWSKDNAYKSLRFVYTIKMDSMVLKVDITSWEME
jgi:hypothetical protein